jgi:hypothetical protein
MGGYCVLVFDAVLSGRNLPAFRKKVLLPLYRRDGEGQSGGRDGLKPYERLLL